MAQGNVYIVIPQGEKTKKIPSKLFDKLGWEETERGNNGEETKRKKEPTWQEVGERYKSQFGDVRTHQWQGITYNVIELELSFLNGEIAELVKLQKGNKKDFLLMTNTEARRWLAGEDVFQSL